MEIICIIKMENLIGSYNEIYLKKQETKFLCSNVLHYRAISYFGLHFT